MKNHKYPAVTLFSKLPILKELFVKMAICVFEVKKGAVALSPTKKTNRSLPKGIERFAAFVYNRIAKNHQQESEDIIPQ